MSKFPYLLTRLYHENVLPWRALGNNKWRLERLGLEPDDVRCLLTMVSGFGYVFHLAPSGDGHGFSRQIGLGSPYGLYDHSDSWVDSTRTPVRDQAQAARDIQALLGYHPDLESRAVVHQRFEPEFWRVAEAMGRVPQKLEAGYIERFGAF